MINKLFILVVVLVAIILAGLLGWVMFSNQPEEQVSQDETGVVDGVLYRSDQLGVSFRMPKEASVRSWNSDELSIFLDTDDHEKEVTLQIEASDSPQQWVEEQIATGAFVVVSTQEELEISGRMFLKASFDMLGRQRELHITELGKGQLLIISIPLTELGTDLGDIYQDVLSSLQSI